MTAIAYKGGVLAADTKMGGSDSERGYVRKIYKSERGTLGAASGGAGVSAEFGRMVERGKIDEWVAGGFQINLGINEEYGQFGAIVVLENGRVVCLDSKGRGIEFEAEFYVEGSASLLLLGAMAAGASAEEAVKIAIKFDIWCGGEVQVEKI